MNYHGQPRPLFQIWDKVASAITVTGNYRRWEDAQARVDRMNPVDYCTGCGGELSVPVAVYRDCPQPEVHRG